MNDMGNGFGSGGGHPFRRPFERRSPDAPRPAPQEGASAAVPEAPPVPSPGQSSRGEDRFARPPEGIPRPGIEPPGPPQGAANQAQPADPVRPAPIAPMKSDSQADDASAGLDAAAAKPAEPTRPIAPPMPPMDNTAPPAPPMAEPDHSARAYTETPGASKPLADPIDPEGAPSEQETRLMRRPVYEAPVEETDLVGDVVPADDESPEPEQRMTTAMEPIGEVLQIAGSSSQVRLDPQRLAVCSQEADPSIQLAGLVGSQIKVKVGQIWLLASVRTQTLDRATGEIIAEIDFLGEGQEEKLTGRIRNFTRGITNYPVPGSKVYASTNADLAQVYASDGRANVQIGKVFPTKDIRAGLYIDAMLGKHFALLGSTGTGKSTSAALILHRIVEAAPEGHILMIDPHGEYSAAFRGTGQIFDVGNLKVPYWLMNFEEHCEVFITNEGTDRQADMDILSKCLLKARSKNRMAENMSRLTVDSPIPYLLSDLTNAIQDEMGKLDKATNTSPFLRVKTKIEEIKGDPRYQFMFSGMLVADTMTEVIQRLFRMPGNGSPISIVDVSGVPSEITSTVVALLSRMVFDFAIWGRDEKTRPILLVCEEAHRYVPNEKNADKSSVGRILSRIAKEGRKYGISLGLITQRPSDLAEGVLSQCGTILSMRLNNERDQDFVKAAMPEGARGFLATIPALRNRECIVCGEGTAIPMRVTFDDLEERKRPASEDPSFSDLWNESGGEEEAVERIVTRWRAQHR